MSSIKLILMLLLSGATVVYFAKMRSRLLDRGIVILLSAGAALLIVNPERTTIFANSVGVGRGADLVLYVVLICGGFIILVLFSKIRQLEDKTADIARALALAMTGFETSKYETSGRNAARREASISGDLADSRVISDPNTSEVVSIKLTSHEPKESCDHKTP